MPNSNIRFVLIFTKLMLKYIIDYYSPSVWKIVHRLKMNVDVNAEPSF